MQYLPFSFHRTVKQKLSAPFAICFILTKDVQVGITVISVEVIIDSFYRNIPGRHANFTYTDSHKRYENFSNLFPHFPFLSYRVALW